MAHTFIAYIYNKLPQILLNHPEQNARARSTHMYGAHAHVKADAKMRYLRLCVCVHYYTRRYATPFKNDDFLKCARTYTSRHVTRIINPRDQIIFFSVAIATPRAYIFCTLWIIFNQKKGPPQMEKPGCRIKSLYNI